MLICFFRHMDVYNKSYCGLIITAACCLHNICISVGDDIETEPYIPVNFAYNQDTDNRRGIAKRDEICQEMFSQIY